jgi:sulfide:quinone oxidoreductase
VRRAGRSEPSFVFRFAKLDVVFGRTAPETVRPYYRDLAKPGVRVLQSTVRDIDPLAKRVVTDSETLDADILVV